MRWNSVGLQSGSGVFIVLCLLHCPCAECVGRPFFFILFCKLRLFALAVNSCGASPLSCLVPSGVAKWSIQAKSFREILQLLSFPLVESLEARGWDDRAKRWKQPGWMHAWMDGDSFPDSCWEPQWTLQEQEINLCCSTTEILGSFVTAAQFNLTWCMHMW